ncbi:MaoC family dehydratase [Longimicrobium sp.]|uniref:MaoC family dehydratase n=1 Tax=Longimicrobium sp. TaxID=2029185 RepID=UPI002E36848A|nr:MaoC family dehydratase [Longimicrobium sp.]HEX6037055.1 MaoC family dehydratase [Longimicrobium sp.]
MDYEELRVGQSAEFRKTVTETDVVLYAGITGDLNPAHVDEVAAAASRFGGRIAHGMLSAGFISAVLGTRLPGPGTIYLEQTLRFTAPVRIGDTVTARVTVSELLDRRRVRLATTVLTHAGQTVVEGEALVMVPRPPVEAA